jgi:hypothetical protein
MRKLISIQSSQPVMPLPCQYTCLAIQFTSSLSTTYKKQKHAKVLIYLKLLNLPLVIKKNISNETYAKHKIMTYSLQYVYLFSNCKIYRKSAQELKCLFNYSPEISFKVISLLQIFGEFNLRHVHKCKWFIMQSIHYCCCILTKIKNA